MKKTIAAMLALLMLLTLPLASLAEGWTNPAEETLLSVGVLTVPVPADWQSEQTDEGVMLAPWDEPEVGLGVMMSDLGMDMTSQGDTIVTMLLEMVAVGIAEGMGVDVSDNKEYVTVDGRKALRIGCTDDEGDEGLMVVVPDGSTVYVLLALASLVAGFTC